MRPFKIQPHSRLQEWVAEEKGYFSDEGLDYIFHVPGSSLDEMGVGRTHSSRVNQPLSWNHLAPVPCRPRQGAAEPAPSGTPSTTRVRPLWMPLRFPRWSR